MHYSLFKELWWESQTLLPLYQESLYQSSLGSSPKQMYVCIVNIIHVPCNKIILQCLFQQLHNFSVQKYTIIYMFRPEAIWLYIFVSKCCAVVGINIVKVLQILFSPTKALFYIPCILPLLFSCMLRHSCHLQGANISVVKMYSHNIVLQ